MPDVPPMKGKNKPLAGLRAGAGKSGWGNPTAKDPASGRVAGKDSRMREQPPPSPWFCLGMLIIIMAVVAIATIVLVWAVVPK